jgi:hypothetical protein
LEFFARARNELTADALARHITGPALAAHCDSIDQVIRWREDRDEGEIYCLWGQFAVRREVIRHGLRFTLPGCPNALAWTLTAEPGGALVHCTINRAEHEPDFIDSIHLFVHDWRAALERLAEADAPQT